VTSFHRLAPSPSRKHRIKPIRATELSIVRSDSQSNGNRIHPSGALLTGAPKCPFWQPSYTLAKLPLFPMRSSPLRVARRLSAGSFAKIFPVSSALQVESGAGQPRRDQSGSPLFKRNKKPRCVPPAILPTIFADEIFAAFRSVIEADRLLPCPRTALVSARCRAAAGENFGHRLLWLSR